MYSENSFKNYIFWLKVRRIFFMVIFSIVGALVGIALSEFLINILLFDTFFRIVTITISTLLFFSISWLITATTGKEIQEGYWKIAVLRKLTVISKKLDVLEDFDLNSLKKDLSAENTLTNKQNNKNLSKKKIIQEENLDTPDELENIDE